MNKRIYWLLIILGLFSISGTKIKSLVRLTIVNKAERRVELSLTGKYFEQSYYLYIPEGDKLMPFEKTFTIVPDVYTSSLYYWELWDPVYGNQCGTKGQTLDVTRNVRLTVLPCDLTPANGGEPPQIVKYGGQNRKVGR
jgi:hypothetical protein